MIGSWAKVELKQGDIVADLADRACTKFRSWDADASQVSLHRVEWTGAGDPDAAAERAALSAKPLPSSLCLEETRGGPRLFILVRKTAGAAAACAYACRGEEKVFVLWPLTFLSLTAAGGGIDFAAALASALAPVLTGVAELRRRADLSDLRRLYVQAAVSTGGSSRSPRKEGRLELKAHVLDYYGLRVPGDAERSCFTHLGGATVPFERATMAHVWPSAEADAAGLLADELRLPRSFHLDPRNFSYCRWTFTTPLTVAGCSSFPRRTQHRAVQPVSLCARRASMQSLSTVTLQAPRRARSARGCEASMARPWSSRTTIGPSCASLGGARGRCVARRMTTLLRAPPRTLPPMRAPSTQRAT